MVQEDIETYDQGCFSPRFRDSPSPDNMLLLEIIARRSELKTKLE